MANQREDILYTVKKWQRTEKKNGVIIHLSAYDSKKHEWYDIRSYVPFEINIAEGSRKSVTIAKFAKDDAVGARGCWLHIPIEFVPKPKEVAMAKTAEPLEDGDTPF